MSSMLFRTFFVSLNIKVYEETVVFIWGTAYNTIVYIMKIYALKELEFNCFLYAVTYNRLLPNDTYNQVMQYNIFEYSYF